MRIAVWSYAFTVLFLCLTAPLLGGMFHWIYAYWLPKGRTLSSLTVFFLAHRWYTPVIALPWLGAAVWFSRRGGITPNRVFAYAGISTFAIVFLLTAATIVFLIPFVPWLDLRGFHIGF